MEKGLQKSRSVICLKKTTSFNFNGIIVSFLNLLTHFGVFFYFLKEINTKFQT